MTRLFLLTVSAASSISLSTEVFAQQASLESPKNTPVRERSRPEYEALGVRAGTFQLFPSIRGAQEYNSNVFAVSSDATEDFSLSLSPRADLQSNWSVHAFNASVGATHREYFSEDDLSYTDFNASLDGRYDIDRSFNVSGGVRYYDGVEPLQSSPIVAELAEAIEYNTFGASLSALKSFNRIQMQLSAGYDEFDYSDAKLTDGTTVSQDSRDREVTTYGVRGDYSVSPDTTVFAEVNHNQKSYDAPAAGQVDRNSDGYEVLVGTNFSLTNIATGEVAVGYFEQSYDEPGVEANSGFDYRVGVNWFVDELVTVSVNADRNVAEAGVDNAVGYVTSNYGIQADYEYRRNTIVSAGLGYSSDDYDPVDRQDDRFQIYLSTDYLVSRDAVVDARIAYIEQSSDGLVAGRDYDVVEATIGLTLKR